MTTALWLRGRPDRPGWALGTAPPRASAARWRRSVAVQVVVVHAGIVAGYVAYTAIANRAPRHFAAALGRTRAIVAVEDRLHIGLEQHLNRWWAASHLRVVAGNYYYDTMHFVVPLAVLAWLVLARRHSYPRALAVLLSASLIALAVFWRFPVAPPRLLPHGGFIDTIAISPTPGSSGAHGITSAENPLAAMPSLHVVWAAWAAVQVIRLTRSALPRVLAVGHGLVTVFVIVATANHLFADAAGGLLVLALAAGLVHLGSVPVRVRARTHRRRLAERSVCPGPGLTLRR